MDQFTRAPFAGLRAAANTPILDDRHATACIVAVAGLLFAWAAIYAPAALLAIAGVVAVLYYFDRPFELLLVMVFLIPFNFIFAIGPIPIAAELLKVAIWVPLLAAQSAKGARVKQSRFRRSVIVLGALIVLSLFRAYDFGFSLKETTRFGSDLGLLYVIPTLVDTREKVFKVLRALVYSSFLVALYGFYQFAIQDFGALFWIVNPRMHTDLAPGRSAFWGWRNRITSVLTSEMELGHYLNLCIPFSIVLWLHERARRPRWSLISLALLAALVLTFTFGAWGSLAAGLILSTVLLRKGSGWKLLLAGAIVIAIGTVLVLGPLRPYVGGKMFGNAVGSFGYDVFTRLEAWRFAGSVWVSHPVIGVGEGNYQRLTYLHDNAYAPWSPTGSSPHETYLYILAQFGLAGFASILAIVLGALRSDWKLRVDPKMGIVALGLAFALTVNLIGWFSDDSTLFSPHAGYLVWLIIGLSEAVRNIVLRARGSREIRTVETAP